jgi:hypothetical protein
MVSQDLCNKHSTLSVRNASCMYVCQERFKDICKEHLQQAFFCKECSEMSAMNTERKLVCQERFIDVCQVHLMQAYLSGMLHRCLSGTLNTISSVRNTSQMSVRNI